MNDMEPLPLAPDHQQLIERAARHAADYPSLPMLALIDEHGLSVAEASAALQRAREMKLCRGAFA